MIAGAGAGKRPRVYAESGIPHYKVVLLRCGVLVVRRHQLRSGELTTARGGGDAGRRSDLLDPVAQGATRGVAGGMGPGFERIAPGGHCGRVDETEPELDHASGNGNCLIDRCHGLLQTAL